MRHRVVVTGIGALTPIGTGPGPLWNGVRRGVSAVRRIERFDPSPFASQMAAEIDFDPLDSMTAKRAGRLDRFSQFAVVSARMALEDASLLPCAAAAAGAGIYIGSALGGVAFAEGQHEAYVRGGARAVNPMLALSVFGASASSNIAIELGLTGPSLANGNSCAAGVIAIGEAARLIADGRATTMLAGGAEAPLAPLTFGAFSLIRVLSTRNDDPATASRPFDAGRDGFVMAEGAAVLVLESLDSAVDRDAHVYAEILGYATTIDAHHMTAPHPEGVHASRAMSDALEDARLPADAIDYVNAHASSTLLNDPTECRAIRAALGAHAERVPVSGTKGLHGHALGATGAIETAITVMALERGQLPGTANLRVKDPACDLEVLMPEGRESRARYAIKNAFGFGGINASLVLGAVD